MPSNTPFFTPPSTHSRRSDNAIAHPSRGGRNREPQQDVGRIVVDIFILVAALLVAGLILHYALF